MNKYILGGIIAVFVLMLFQTYQIGTLKGKIATLSVQQAAISTGVQGAIDMSGWTENEKMMYEHHGTLPARSQANTQQSSPGSEMVGGC